MRKFFYCLMVFLMFFAACGGGGGGEIIQDNTPPTLTGIRSVVLGENHSCAQSNIDSLTWWCWGYNSNGQLATSSATNKILKPTLLSHLASASIQINAPGSDLQLVLGERHSCQLQFGRVACWGDNASGRLGDGSSVDSYSPVGLKTTLSESMFDVSVLAIGYGHGCILKNSAAGALNTKIALCWGSNTSGQLGDGTKTNRYFPVLVNEADKKTLVGVLQIVAGKGHTCAVVSSQKELRCWGANTYGQLGVDVADKFVNTPKYKNGAVLSNVDQVVLGTEHTCALISGQAWCFGRNLVGQLGDGAEESRSFASFVLDNKGVVLSGITKLASRGDQTCAIDNRMQLWCWGENHEGQLGSGDKINKNSAALLGLAGVVDVAVGGAHVCAVLNPNQALFCWGKNSYGALGVGHDDDVLVPVAVVM